jgi:hypothetical protein
MRVPLRALAHARSGDKGDTSNVAVIAYDVDLFPMIRDQLTAASFKTHYAGVVRGEVERYEVARLGVLNFVAHGALGGGVSRSLCLDNYGKTLAARILDFPIEIPERLANRLLAQGSSAVADAFSAAAPERTGPADTQRRGTD